MKKITYVLFFLALVSFGQVEHKSKVKFTAKIENRNSDTLKIYGPNRFLEVIAVKNGVFEASFETTEGIHQFTDGIQASVLFFKDGDDLKLTMNAKKFDESIVYAGKGADENNYLAQKVLSDAQFELSLEDLLAKDRTSFEKALAKRKISDLADMESKKLSPKLVEGVKAMMNNEELIIKKQYEQRVMAAKLAGTQSPNFDFENHKGGKTSLESLKGKYVYIDVWATWCGPCRIEIPFLKKIEEKYQGKNIEFVSISVDRLKDYEKWKTFVTKKELGGIQLYADKGINSEFFQAYGISLIPRFLLIGPKGEVIDADAPKPSEDKLVLKLDSLLN